MSALYQRMPGLPRTVLRRSDGLIIPFDVSLTEFREFLSWQSHGNVPDPAPASVASLTPKLPGADSESPDASGSFPQQEDQQRMNAMNGHDPAGPQTPPQTVQSPHHPPPMQPQPDLTCGPDTLIPVTLRAGDWNTVMGCVAKQPWDVADPLIQAMRQQVIAHVQRMHNTPAQPAEDV